jgi:hypothetical protein
MNTTTMIFESYPRPAYFGELLDAGAEARSASWFARAKQVFADLAAQAAQSNAESPLWDIAQGDRRVMAELMLARKCDDSADTPQVPAMSEMTEADTVASVVPKRSFLLGQGWARVIEDAYQARTRNALWRYA